MKEVRIIIAGGRDFINYKYLEDSALKVIHQLECNNIKTGLNTSDMEKERKQIKIISGKARGADTLGERFGIKCGFEIKEFPAAIMLYIIDKIFTICFIIHELGIKKDKKEGTDND